MLYSPKAQDDLGRQIEQLRTLYENEAKRLRATKEELTQIKQSLDQVNNLAQNEQQTFVYLMNTAWNFWGRQQEALEKKRRRQRFARDMFIGIVSGMIGGYLLWLLLGSY
jgi:septation ring formation regulator EzrA